MSRIDSFNTPSFDSNGLQSRSGGASQPAVGQLAGHQVQVDEGDFMPSGAAKEIGMHPAEKAQGKHSSERKKEAVRPLEVMTAEAVSDCLGAAQAFEDPEQLVFLAKRRAWRIEAAAYPVQVGLRSTGQGEWLVVGTRLPMDRLNLREVHRLATYLPSWLAQGRQNR